MNKETVTIGEAIKVVDEHGVQHDALCTQNWGNDTGEKNTINIVYISKDANKRDQYGAQKEHLSSCQHRDMTTAPGRYWFKHGTRK